MLGQPEIAGTAGYSPESCHEFFYGEGFYQVVVSACVQTVYSVVKTVQGGCQDDGGGDALAAQGL